jgi:RNA polymerase sigma factor, sigma-70 family
MSLENLVDKCKKRDNDAMSVLYEIYFQQMFNICLSYVKDEQIAKDIVHDGFIIVFTAIHSLRKSERLGSWIKRIMTNLCLQYLNQDKNKISIEKLGEDEQPLQKEEWGEDVLPMNVIVSMIDKLPKGYRKIFKLSVLEGLSHQEIAEILHIDPHSSSSQLYRAKKKLKEMITKYRTQMLTILLIITSLILYIHNDTTTKRSIATYKKTQYTTPDISNIVTKTPLLITSNIKPTPITKQLISSDKRSNKAEMEKSAIPIINKITVLDSIHIETQPILKIERDSITHTAQQYTVKHIGKTPVKKWNLTLYPDFAQGLSQTMPILIQSFLDSSSEPIKSWEEYYKKLKSTYNSPDKRDKETDALLEVAQRNSGEIEKEKLFEKPTTYNIRLYKSVGKHWGIETGLRFTRLVANFKTGKSSYLNEKQKIDYIGVPFNAVYTIGNYKTIKLYSSGGITLDIPIKASSKISYIVDNHSVFAKQQSISNAPLQWSVQTELGISYKIFPHIELFFAPNLHYYLNNGNKIETSWKERPLQLSWPMGVRLSY